MASKAKKKTPLMVQYASIKKQYQDMILFFRMGDFYEMFYDDARVVARELDITLTSRDQDKASGEKVPLAGIPYHALDSYLSRLIKKGYKVAICEQVEDPKKAKGLVKREVVRVVTPGTVLEDSMLAGADNNYLMSMVRSKGGYGLAFIDVSTGEFLTTELTEGDVYTALITEITRYMPAEVLIPIGLSEDEKFMEKLKDSVDRSILFSPYSDTHFIRDFAYGTLTGHFDTVSLDGLGIEEMPLSIQACGGLISYLKETQKTTLNFIEKVRVYRMSNHLLLDSTTLRNLEVFSNIRDKTSRGTLLEVMDSTKTSLGARLMKKWIKEPLIDEIGIEARLDAVELLVNDLFLRSDIRDELRKVQDLERLVTRVLYGSANARDLVGMKTSLQRLPGLRELLEKKKGESVLLDTIQKNLDDLSEIVDLIEGGIVDSPPLSVKEGGIIKPGCSEELDELHEASTHGKQWVRELEEQERRKTTIKSLKVRFNKVFGYYIEVSKTNLDLVPDNYVRKQTLANCERFITDELKNMEDKILSAQERSESLEYTLFLEIREEIAKHSDRIRGVASALAEIDVLTTMADVAVTNNFVRPELCKEDSIHIKDGRHPVVERVIQEGFVPNDTLMDCLKNRLLIITGPNMAGKSTYMRQVAIITIMAQMGSFVPAAEAKIGIVDRIFTRVGAFDDLVRGQSTFMVEMTELANILNNATANSLILLDEIGRGTSTYDGLSIAWAVSEHIHDHIGAKTLFATHYHQLTALENKLEGVKNYNILVKETESSIAFLRKIAPGSTDKSYGIEVAKIAGVPKDVIDSANRVLQDLEDTNGNVTVEVKKSIVESAKQNKPKPAEPGKPVQMVLFSQEDTRHPVVEEIKALDPNNITPMEALTILYNLKKKTQQN